MVIVEPDVSLDKLKIAISQGHESSEVDYKARFDPNDRRDLVELVKDVGAMQSLEHGGYLVIGVDNSAKPTSSITDESKSLFDEANLRAKIARYIPEPFGLLSAVHKIGNDNVAMIYVGPSPQGCCIFRQNGERDSNSALLVNSSGRSSGNSVNHEVRLSGLGSARDSNSSEPFNRRRGSPDCRGGAATTLRGARCSFQELNGKVPEVPKVPGHVCLV